MARGWASSKRREELPKDWQARRAMARLRAGGQCEHVSKSGVRCKRRGTDADHALDRDNHDVLQWLCPEHHRRKTARESWAALSSKRYKGRRKRDDRGAGAL